jgi:hypothetical protein
MTMGMTLDEYWHGKPELCIWYREKRRQEIEHQSYMGWLSGLYIYDAFATVTYNANKPQGRRAEKYMSEPIRLTPYTEQEQKERVKRERAKAVAFFKGLKDAYDKKDEVILVERDKH